MKFYSIRMFLCQIVCCVLVYNQDEDDTLVSRERVADFISGVMLVQEDASLAHSVTADVKCEFTACDDYEARHFFSQFRIVKNISSGHGFVI